MNNSITKFLKLVARARLSLRPRLIRTACIGLGCGIGIGCLGIGLGLGIQHRLQTPRFQNHLTTTIAAGITQFTRTPVTIGRIQWELPKKLVLCDVVIMDPYRPVPILSVQTISLQINLWKLMQARGDILAAISKISIKNGQINIVKNRYNQWNILRIIPPFDPKIPPHTFRGTVTVDHINVQYVDQIGWDKHHPHPFRTQVHDISARLNYRRPDSVSFSGSGWGIGTGRGDVYGQFSSTSKTPEFRFNLVLGKLEIGPWSSYLVPTIQNQWTATPTRLAGHISSTRHPINGFPFQFNLRLPLRNLTGKLMPLGTAVTHGSGILTVTPFGAQFSRFSAHIGTHPAMGYGSLNFINQTTNFLIYSPRISAHELMGDLPPQLHETIQGTGNLTLRFTGPIAHPIRRGTWQADRVMIGPNVVKNLKFAFDTHNTQLAGKFSGVLIPHIGSMTSPSINFSGKMQRNNAGWTCEITTAKTQFLGQVIQNGEIHILSQKSNEVRANISLQIKQKYIPITLRIAFQGPAIRFSSSGELSPKIRFDLTGTWHNYPTSSITLVSANLVADPGIVSGNLRFKNGAVDWASVNWSSLAIKPVFRHWVNSILPNQTSVTEWSGITNGSIEITHRPRKISGGLPETLPGFLSMVTVQAEATIENGHWMTQPVDFCSISMQWDGQKATWKNGKFRVGDTVIRWSGEYDKTWNIQIEPNSMVNPSDLQLFPKLSPFSGLAAVSGQISGRLLHPAMNLEVAATNLKMGPLIADSVIGNIQFNNQKIVTNSLKIQRGKERISLAGWILTTNSSQFDADISVESSSILSASEWLRLLRAQLASPEVYSKIAAGISETNPDGQNVHLNSPLSPTGAQSAEIPDINRLYSKDNSESAIGILSDRQLKLDTELSELTPSDLAGDLSGHIYITSDTEVKATANLQIENLKWQNWSVKDIKILTAASRSGISYSWTATHIENTHRSMQSIMSAGIITNGYLNITQFDIVGENWVQKRAIIGLIPLKSIWNHAADPLHLEINLDRNAIQLLAFLYAPVQSITNAGSIQITVDGTLQSLIVSAPKFTLKDVAIQFQRGMITSPIHIINPRITLQNNRLSVEHIGLLWAGPDTTGKNNDTPNQNRIDLTGFINLRSPNLQDLNGLQGEIEIHGKSTRLTLNWPGLYRGTAQLTDPMLAGNFTIPLTSKERDEIQGLINSGSENGPTLNTTITLSEGQIGVSSTGQTQYPMIHLNCALRIDQDVTLTGGLLGTGFLEGLANQYHLVIQPTNAPIRITGTWNSPKISDTFTLADGSIVFLNREFSLMQSDVQHTYFTDRPSLMGPQSIALTTISTDTSHSQLIPVFSVRALTEIRPILPTESSKAVVMIIDGPLSNGILFDIFNLPEANQGAENPTGQPTVLPPTQPTQPTLEKSIRFSSQLTTATNSQDLAYLFQTLVPGLGSATGRTPAANPTGQFIGEIGQRQLKDWLRRIVQPIEKNVAKNIGFSDVKIDYDFGSNGLNLGGDRAAQPSQLSIRTTSVLSKQFQIQLNTNVNLSTPLPNQPNTLKLSEVELAYLLSQSLRVTLSNFSQANQTAEKPIFSIRWGKKF